MKRLVLFTLLIALPAVVFGSTQRYIVVTHHPYREAVRSLPREDFDPTERAEMRVRDFSVINGFAADLTDEEATRLLQSGEVDDIEPVLERHVLADSVTAGQQTTPYGVSMVNAPAVWPVTKGAAINGTGPIHVAVIDTGIDYKSPELSAVYKGGHNFITGSDDPFDDFGHGSHVSGIIAAADDNEGVVGIAPAVDIFALKVLDQCGSGSNENVIHAIDWIIQKRATIGGNWVVNLSLGSSDSSVIEQAAFQRGVDAGILFFAASGNSYDTNPVDGLSFPAGYPMVVSVGAIDSTQKVATFSQRGPGLKVVAPGVAVLSTFIDVSEIDGINNSAGSVEAYRVHGYDTSNQEFTCSAAPTVSGALVDCGVGNTADFPTRVSGNIALILRGGTSTVTGTTLTFAEKAKNAKRAGAVGVIVYNNRATDNPGDGPGWGMTGLTRSSDVPPIVVGVTQAQGQQLIGMGGAATTMGFARHNSIEGWQLESGTSMASPHATAVAALVWAAAPTASASDVANAVINTAKDLGDAGVDTIYGHGVVNALDAAKQLNPGAFGSGGTPPNTPRTGRTPGRRGIQ